MFPREGEKAQAIVIQSILGVLWPPPCLTHGHFFPLMTETLEKPSQGDFGEGAHPSLGGLIKTPSVSRMQLYFLHTPKPNFLWISDHLLFPIMLLFTLSIWRIQMLNDKREREERGGGGRRIPFCLKDKILEMPPSTASPKRSSTWQRLAQLSLCQMII